ncbi:pseudaminic acid synthase [Colwellia sp. 75C3]|uniref:pseudaminic acid synthase n=1 Tax=Colwellia sp. 75C3 TaxID=888425 RepID=UPI000C342F9A|nr:pseudaminic acid synthase [Colwellia sp. 75C3]PKG81126.1 pseudaminic acid synthase [Colwellia sp. 75C3]
MVKYFSQEITINEHKIGEGHPPYIIAELSANHNGSIDKALAIIDMAKEMGADAIKIQTYTADTMTINCDNKYFQIEGGLWDGYNLHKLYQWAQTPFEWHKTIFEHAKKIGITLFSSPFDETAVDLLESLNCPAYKIASFEATDLLLIEKVAQTGKPLIISTGMANEQEIDEIVHTVKTAGVKELILLHCISSYPAPVEQSNLTTIPDIKKRWEVLSGLSDHTLGTSVAITSVALGASVIEKHVTLSRNDKGPDAEFSLEPQELQQLVIDSRNAWLSLGTAGYEKKPSEEANLKFRRSLFFVDNIKKGTVISEQHIRRIRPGFGLAPKYYPDVLGKTVTQDIERGTPVTWEVLA